MRGGTMEGANLSSFGATDGAMRAGGSRDTRLARLHSRKARAWKALVKGAHFAIDWADAAENGGRHVVNKADGKVPSFNLLAFPTGPTMNESGATTPTRTNNYGSQTDPSGVTFKSTLLVATANNQVNYFYRPSTCPVIPTGKYGLRLRARLLSGGSSFTLSFGLSSGYATQTVQDLDWSSAANLAATTFETEFTYSGAGDIAIRFPTSGNTMVIDRIQLYYGGLASIPAWDAEVFGGARKAFSYPGSIPLDATGNWNLTEDSGGAWLIEPNLDDKTYTAMTVIHVCSISALTSTETVVYGVASPTSTRLSTTLTSMHVGFEGDNSPYEGRIKYAPATAFRAQTGFGALGQGVVALGQTLSTTGRRMFVNEIPALTDATSWGPVTANRWHVGSATTTQRAFVDTFEVVGKHCLTFVWDRQLSDTEYQAAVRLMLDRVANRGLGKFRDFHVMSGDSNWTQGTGDFVQLLSANNAFTPKRNLWFCDTSVGGTGIAEVYGNSPYPAAMDPAGRLLTNETTVALAAAKAGRKVCYHFGVGTNDFNEAVGVPNWGYAAYDATRDAVVKYLLNLHSNISVMEYTIIAAGTGSGRDYTPTARTTINANIRTRQALDRTGRHFLCDIGAHPQLGDQTTADLGTYLIEAAPGGIHYNASGDVLANAFINPVIATWRTRMGMDTY